jgi:hypothetical protein
MGRGFEVGVGKDIASLCEVAVGIRKGIGVGVAPSGGGAHANKEMNKVNHIANRINPTGMIL